MERGEVVDGFYMKLLWNCFRYSVPGIVTEWVRFLQKESLPEEIKGFREELLHYTSDWRAFAYAATVFDEEKFRTAFEKLKVVWKDEQLRKTFMKNMALMRGEGTASDIRSLETMKKVLLYPLIYTNAAFKSKYQEYYDRIEDGEDEELDLLLKQDFNKLQDMEKLVPAQNPQTYRVPELDTDPTHKKEGTP